MPADDEKRGKAGLCGVEEDGLNGGIGLTAPPTSYSNQLTCVPLRLMSNECSLTPSVCNRTLSISSESQALMNIMIAQEV